MALFSIYEFIDFIFISICVGYLFSKYFSQFNVFKKPRDYVERYYFGRTFTWSDFFFSMCIVVPAIILHELGHKFAALAFGYQATFYSALSINKLLHGASLLQVIFEPTAILLIIALIAVYLGGNFLFFVPAYVAFSATATPLQTAIIAFAGPGVNLLLWLGAKQLIRSRKISQKYVPFAIITSKINMLLFIFNMIPIPGFDGSKVLSGLIGAFFH